ncbi:MAG TPA: hypothetical protein VGK74_19940 [Symbiobacteriaceae bacterium]
MNDSPQTFKVYGSWQGLTATTGDLASSFSNLRLAFSAPVADGGQPGVTTSEELLLGAAIAGYCAAFVELTVDMAIDLALIEVEGELKRAYDELEGNLLRELNLTVVGTLRTGVGFEKVHDMFRRAVGLAQHRSPVLKALAQSMKIRIEPHFREAGGANRQS